MTKCDYSKLQVYVCLLISRRKEKEAYTLIYMQLKLNWLR